MKGDRKNFLIMQKLDYFLNKYYRYLFYLMKKEVEKKLSGKKYKTTKKLNFILIVVILYTRIFNSRNAFS